MEEKTVKKGKKGVVIATIVILILGGITVFNYLKFRVQKEIEVRKEERVPVQVMESRFADLKWILEQTGDIRPKVEVAVYPKVPGKIIERLLVERGDYIRKGGLIATLEDDTIRAQIEEAKAVLESAGANLKQVEANLEVIEKDRLRLESLYKEKAVAKQRLDHIQAEYKATAEAKDLAGAQIKRARASLKQLEILYNDHSIYAPVSGYVSARYVDRGAMSGMQQPIVRISNDEELKIVTTVTEKDFSAIKKGMKVEIEVDAFPDRVFTGTVSVINPTIDPATRTGEIEIHISNKNLSLISGMFAHVRLYLGQKSALVVARDALNKLPGTGSYYVYVVEDGRAVLKNVKTGLDQGNDIEITDGLKAGEKLVVKGQERLKDGSPVIIEDQGSGIRDQGVER
ncbi:MAG: efflux RND transporter periplasmic adaptor subunit [Desulfobacterales bacterium]|nr:efflux RND transporter periplasmic adaptor subunit [Desulfobacterales bacterium]